MARELKRGDRVEWNFRRAKVLGVVVRKLTSPTTIGSQKVVASLDNPRFLVRSEKTGKEAVHKASALRRAPKRLVPGSPPGGVPKR
jgi:hypothetical protein